MQEIISNIDVPEWAGSLPSLDTATPEQRDFYYHWSSELETGNYIDLGDSRAYIWIYLHSQIKTFLTSTDIETLVTKLKRIKTAYHNYKSVSDTVVKLIGDAYISQGNYDKGWNYLKKTVGLRVAETLSVKSKCNDKSIDGETLISLGSGSSSVLTKFGKKHREEIVSLVSLFLEDFHRIHGQNLIEYMCGGLDYGNLTTSDFERFREFYPKQEDYNRMVKWYSKDRWRYGRAYEYYLFSGVDVSTCYFAASLSRYIECQPVPYVIEVACVNEAKRIVRESENIFRKEIGVYRVGEESRNETELFKKILNAFPDEKVIHHGRPSWLNRQHLDVYFPKRGIGIEYQGKQRQKTVDFVKGEGGLKKREKLDKTKANLCRKNNCRLVYVYENYELDAVIAQIGTLLDE